MDKLNYLCTVGLFSIVSYAHIVVDSKPSDMATTCTYTTMKMCDDMCLKAGQQYSLQTFGQKLYAITADKMA